MQTNSPNTAESFLPVGHCIYCGKSTGRLSKEHIIPYGLGGNLVLPEASCERCAKITARVEQFCLRSMLGSVRVRLKLPTRRPSERENDWPIEFVTIDGRREERRVPHENIPLALLGLRVLAPGFLRGVPPQSKFDGELIARFINEELMQHMSAAGNRVKLGTVEPLIFARMLAKIAHSYAIAKVGSGAFKPMLIDLILGKSDLAPYLVGGDASAASNPLPGVLHDVYPQDCLTNGKKHLLVAIQLFAFAGMPRYHVVVGPLN